LGTVNNGETVKGTHNGFSSNGPYNAPKLGSLLIYKSINEAYCECGL
jgi:hypothetical protein